MKNSFIIPLFGALLLFAVWGHGRLTELSSPPAPPANPQRIVSLAPSVTETLFALGLGTRVVGVTDFCAYPPEVANIPKVAGFSSVNFEAVLRARPDLVALPVDKLGSRMRLEQLGLPVLMLDTRSLSGFLAAVRALGEATGRGARAEALLQDLNAALDAARLRAKGRPKPRVLFSVMHSYEGLGYISEINVIGRDGFYNELIEAAGGINAYQGDLPFPLLSREAIIFLDPDVIIDVVPPSEDLAAIRRDWESLSGVRAIRQKRLHLFTGGADTIPGPRFPLTLAKLSLAFYPTAPEGGQ